MNNKDTIGSFVIYSLKSFFILYTFAVILPKIIGFCLYYFIYKNKVYYNSTFVINLHNIDCGFVKSYLYTVYRFLSFW